MCFLGERWQHDLVSTPPLEETNQWIHNICTGCAASMWKRRAKEGTEWGGGRGGREEDRCNQGWALVQVQTDAGCARGPWWSAVLLLSHQTIYIQHTDSLWAWKRKLLHLVLFLPNHSIPHFYPTTHSGRLKQGHKFAVHKTKTQHGLSPKSWLINTNKKQLMTDIWCWSNCLWLFVVGSKSRTNLGVRSSLRSKVNCAAWIHQIRGPADRMQLWHHQ